ncbi:hypothetical protein GCM10020331_035700 [Ectobacillus funiculus]
MECWRYWHCCIAACRTFFYRPVIILGIDSVKKIAKGSARSIEGFDLFANLSDCRDILPHFGGHPMAAGMTLDMDHVDELRRRLNELAAEQLSMQDLMPVKTVDAVCRLEDITLPVIEEIQQLAPFGVGNPKPRIQVENVSLESIKTNWFGRFSSKGYVYKWPGSSRWHWFWLRSIGGAHLAGGTRFCHWGAVD